MALAVYDRVRETTAVVGTNDAVLLGAVTGFQSFAVVGTTNTCYYTIADQSGNWEVGLGTYNSVGPTMERTTVLSSSAGGAKVNFPVGTKDIFLTYPAEVAVISSNNPSTAGYVLTSNGAGVAPSWQINAGGDVTGPASSTDTAVALFDGNTGKLLKNSGVTIDGSNNVSGVAQLNATTADLTNLEVTNIKAKDGTAAISIANSTGVVTGSTPQVISVNSSSDGLRITQIGSGNALVVEDSANPDSTPFVIQNDGRTVIGNTASLNVGGNAGFEGFQVVGTGAAADVAFAKYINASTGTNLTFAKSRGATIGSNTIVQDADFIGLLRFNATDGTNFIEAARIVAQVDGTPGTNDMPGRLVFSTTADGASSPTERMRINNAGRVGIGTTSLTGYSLHIGVPATGATTNYGISLETQLQSDATGAYYGYFSGPSTVAASFTTSSIRHFEAYQGTIGAGSAVTNQYGFLAGATLTGATNNYGFYSNIASGTGRYNFYAAGSADNYFAGSVGIGGIPYSGTGSIGLYKTLTGATTIAAADISTTINSDVTATANLVSTYVNTQAASFTLSQLRHYNATQGTIGAASAVTNQYGFLAGATLTGATNNYGFYSNIASGTGRYNFCAAGSADNYFAGNVGIGGAPTKNLDVIGSGATKEIRAFCTDTTGSNVGSVSASFGAGAASTISMRAGNGYTYLVSTGASDAMLFGTAAAERMRIDSSGNLIQSAPTTAPTLSTNGTMVFNLTSNTNLRVSVRGSDGVTRTANITLA